MPHIFDEAAITGVLGHMNTDHSSDNLLIVRAFGHAAAVGAIMTGLDGEGGDWQATDAAGTSYPVRVPWPGAPISERHEVRREIVALYDAACERLGVESRSHE